MNTSRSASETGVSFDPGAEVDPCGWQRPDQDLSCATGDDIERTGCANGEIAQPGGRLPADQHQGRAGALDRTAEMREQRRCAGAEMHVRESRGRVAHGATSGFRSKRRTSNPPQGQDLSGFCLGVNRPA